jgi:hypothetical protein
MKQEVSPATVVIVLILLIAVMVALYFLWTTPRLVAGTGASTAALAPATMVSGVNPSPRPQGDLPSVTTLSDSAEAEKSSGADAPR